MYASNAALFDAIVASAGTRLITFPGEDIAQEPLIELLLGAVEQGGPETEPGPSRR